MHCDGFSTPRRYPRTGKKNLRLRRQRRDTRPPRLRPLPSAIRSRPSKPSSAIASGPFRARPSTRSGEARRVEGQALSSARRREAVGGGLPRPRRGRGIVLALRLSSYFARLLSPRLHDLLRLRRGAVLPPKPRRGEGLLARERRPRADRRPSGPDRDKRLDPAAPRRLPRPTPTICHSSWPRATSRPRRESLHSRRLERGLREQVLSPPGQLRLSPPMDSGMRDRLSPLLCARAQSLPLRSLH